MSGERKRRRVVYIALLTVVVAFNLVVSAHISTQERANPEGLETKMAHPDVPEYVPLWWDGLFHEEFDNSSVVVAGGQAEVTPIDDQGSKQSYRIRADSEATLTFRSVYFPGWVARIDNREVTLRRTEEGLNQVIVPGGEHSLTLGFESTWRHIKAGIVSAASALILVAMLYRTRRRNGST
jgi:hypothetical protein